MRAFAALAVASAITCSPAVAGENRFQPAWNPGSRADLVRLVTMDGWNPREADFALDELVAHLETGRSSPRAAFLPGTTNFATDAVNVFVSVDRVQNCRTASASMSNALRPTTSISGAFCPGDQGWTYMAKFLEVTRTPQQGTRVVKTYDVTDLGKVRPR